MEEKNMPLAPDEAEKQIDIKNELEEAKEIEDSLRNLDSALSEMKEEPIVTEVARKPWYKTALRNWKNKPFKQKVISCLGLYAAAFSVMLLLFFAYTQGWDSIAFKSTLEGKVTDTENNAIGEVEIYVDEKLVTKTDEDGNYKATNLNNGRRDVKLIKNGYFTLEETVYVGRYKSERDFRLTQLQKGKIVGKIDLSPGYDPELISIKFDGKDVKVKPDGSFETEEIYEGVYHYEITSPEFVDLVISEFVLKPGVNDVETYQFTPAADIDAQVFEYFSEKSVENLSFEGLGTGNLEFKEGVLKVRDYINIDQVMTLKFKRAGYKDSVVEKRIVMGKNDLGLVNIYKDAKTAYLAPVGSRLQLFAVDLDGENRKQLTDGVFSIKDYAVRGEKVQFLAQNSEGLAVYEVDMNKNVVKLSSSYANLYVNFVSQRIATVEREDDNDYVVKIMNFNGSDPANIYTGADAVGKVAVTDGSAILYTLTGTSKAGLYKYNSDFGSTRRIVEGELELSLSDAQGNNALYTRGGKTFSVNTNSFREIEFGGIFANSVYSGEYAILSSGDQIVIKDSTGTDIGTLQANGAVNSLDASSDGALIFLKDGEGIKGFDLSTKKLKPII